MTETSKAMRRVLWEKAVACNKAKYDAKAKTASKDDRAEVRLHTYDYWTVLPMQSVDEPMGVVVQEWRDGRAVVFLNMYPMFFGALRDAFEFLVEWEDWVGHTRNAELDQLNAQAILSELTVTDK